MSAKQVALVTGSGKHRIGWHVANALADRGYAVVVHYHHSADEAQETVESMEHRGAVAIAIQADLRDETAVRDCFHQVVTQFGRIDVLANCAATWIAKALEDVTAADVRESFEVNTLGTFLCCQHAGLWM